MPYKSRIPRITAELAGKINAVLEEGAHLIEHRAKDRVPVDTGRLRDAIHVEREGPATMAVIAGNKEAFYGHIVEHGGVRQPAQPFLMPATEESRAEIVASAIAVLKSL